MRETRDLFKKIRDTKGTFHAKMGSIKDRNGMDLTEAEDINRSGKVWGGRMFSGGLNGYVSREMPLVEGERAHHNWREVCKSCSMTISCLQLQVNLHRTE